MALFAKGQPPLQLPVCRAAPRFKFLPGQNACACQPPSSADHMGGPMWGAPLCTCPPHSVPFLPQAHLAAWRCTWTGAAPSPAAWAPRARPGCRHSARRSQRQRGPLRVRQHAGRPPAEGQRERARSTHSRLFLVAADDRGVLCKGSGMQVGHLQGQGVSWLNTSVSTSA